MYAYVVSHTFRIEGSCILDILDCVYVSLLSSTQQPTTLLISHVLAIFSMIPQLLAAVFSLLVFVVTLLASFFSPAQPPPVPPLSPVPSPDKKPLLTLTANNTFNIAIISDLHYGEDENTFGPEHDRKSTIVVGKILDYEEPDFVVIST
jgi:hypothetical protein